MLSFLFDTLLRAADLALIAMAISAVYSLIKFPNVALVQYAVVGAFVGMALQKQGLPLTASVAVASAFVGVLAWIFNMTIFVRLLRMSPTIALIGSLALSMMLSAVFLFVFGPAAQRFTVPIAPAMRILGVRVTEMQAVTGVVALLAILLFAALLFRTSVGREMRAISNNSVLAAATGVDTQRTTNLVVFLSGVLAAIGGCLLALRGSVSIDMGTNMLLPVFAAAILGGLGNPLGAVVGAVVIAAAETLVISVNFGPLIGSDMAFLPVNYAPAASFALLVVILLFRPKGIFVSEVSRV